ncbi:ThiS family protein [Colletotrichum orchidophilum]|uniref:ThiS family protein n=1 Tax=Colletotrichum orchidophilum TaxID=1209926 RepID=A0A1G4BE54_9PEZI|nr:ThiS family protein [Colletotrichum orchidophilum]OHE99605.1 ThiS family protein [Colletotrichum orchidophilum]
MAAAPRPPKDHFNVLFFASAGSFTSKQYDVLQAPLPLKKLFDALEERYGGFKERFLESCLVTVNLEYVDIPGQDDSEDPIIQPGDEVAIIPPQRVAFAAKSLSRSPKLPPPPIWILFGTASPPADAEHDQGHQQEHDER